MAEQRRRMEERRKRLKNVKEAAAKKTAESKKYSSGTKKAVTRDISKDSKKKQVVTRDTSKDTIRPKVKPIPKPAEKKPAKPPVVSKPKPKPKNKVPQRFADGAKGGKYDKAVQNQEKAKRNFFQSASGTRGDALPNNPKLKSQTKRPTRSSFPAGRAGASQFAAALRAYNAATKKPTVKKKYDRRGRPRP